MMDNVVEGYKKNGSMSDDALAKFMVHGFSAVTITAGNRRPRERYPRNEVPAVSADADAAEVDRLGDVTAGYQGCCVVGFHSRASFCASAICAGVMSRATKSRFFTAI
jgi:hypothetical protein